MLLRECTDKTEDLPIPTDVLSLFLSSLTPKMQDAAALNADSDAVVALFFKASVSGAVVAIVLIDCLSVF